MGKNIHTHTHLWRVSVLTYIHKKTHRCHCGTSVFCTVLSPKITDYSCILQELKLKHFRSTAAKEILYFAQLKSTIHNIYQMITHYNRTVSVDTEDTFNQLEMVNNVLFVKYFLLFFLLKWGTVKLLKVITAMCDQMQHMQADVSQLLCWITLFFFFFSPDSELFSAYGTSSR